MKAASKKTDTGCLSAMVADLPLEAITVPPENSLVCDAFEVSDADDCELVVSNEDTCHDLTLCTTATGARVDSRELAEHIGIKHHGLFEQVKVYRPDFEQLGLLRFQTEVIVGRGQPEKFVMLNEDQSLLALTFSRNTERVRNLKVRLVKAFGDARRTQGVRETEYLPEYHRLHDSITELAGESSNAKFVHMNVNKALNNFGGLESGQRATASIQNQSLLNVGQMVAVRAMQSGCDHHDGYERVKQALRALTGLLALELDSHGQRT